MTVSTYTQPDNTTQTGSAYKTAIDGAAHVHHRIAGAFACHQQDGNSPDAPDMTVVVDAGAIPGVLAKPTEVAAQSTPALTAPVTNPRYDIVYIDNLTGAVGVAAGAEAASPSDPALPSGKSAVARVRLTVAMTEITNADIDDLRAFGLLGITQNFLLSLLTNSGLLTVLNDFTGATGGSPPAAGARGLVPAPPDGADEWFLRGDGNWAPNAAALTEYFESAEQTITLGSQVSLPHGLSGAPTLVQGHLVNQSNEGSWSAGNIYYIPFGGTSEQGTSNRAFAAWTEDSTNIRIKFPEAAPQIVNASTGARFNIDITKWKVVVRCWR